MHTAIHSLGPPIGNEIGILVNTPIHFAHISLGPVCVCVYVCVYSANVDGDTCIDVCAY